VKTLGVSFIDNLGDFEEISAAFQLMPSHKINQVSWLEYPYLPDVDFRIAYTSQSILLEYTVQEKHLKAIYLKTNEPVYRDSCVEFFISFDKEHYYNLEFNSLGTALVGYGTENKALRQHLPVELVEKIKAKAIVIASKEDGVDHKWVLQLEIPFELFYKENFESLKGVRATANFYKCGDDLPEPHFVSWNKIKAPMPNFHLPQYFGDIQFM
jgi:hypothetical protein